jgi:hypothetical protein
MRIRFQTKDNLIVIRECRDIDEPPIAIVRPIRVEGEPVTEFRRYEYRGEARNGIPTVHET